MAALVVAAAALLLGACDSETDISVPTEITVLFAYSETLADSVGDVGALIRDGLRSANEAYEASNVGIRNEQVGLMSVSYAAEDRLEVLAQLLDPDDGVMDAVHERRDEVEADVVVLVTDTRRHTINGSILATPETAFVLVWWGTADNPLDGLAHELAHLHGARHEVLRDPVMEPFPYGHGFRSDEYRTIMSGGPAELVRRFSGPDQEHQVLGGGVILGDSATADVARVLRETAVYVSNFRGPVTPDDFVPPGTWPTWHGVRSRFVHAR